MFFSIFSVILIEFVAAIFFQDYWSKLNKDFRESKTREKLREELFVFQTISSCEQTEKFSTHSKKSCWDTFFMS